MTMKFKITFHGMSHSEPMETHAHEKLEKILSFLKERSNGTPLFAEMWLKANKQHPHHRAELHIKTPQFDLHAHDEGVDMYTSIDTVIDKMVSLLRKNKERSLEKIHKPETEKKRFSR